MPDGVEYEQAMHKMTSVLSRMEKRMEAQEEKFAEKLDGLVKQQEAQDLRFTSDVREVSKSIERSQTMLESKVEYVIAHQGQQHRELFQTDVRRLVQQMSESILQRTDASTDGSNNSVQRMTKRMDDIVVEIQKLQ